MTFNLGLASFSEISLGYEFGSRVKGNATPSSDHDVALLLESTAAQPLELKCRIIDALQQQDPRADVTFLNDAGSVLKYQVVKHGRLIYEKKRGLGKKFQVQAWKEFFDFQPTLEFFYQRKIA